MEKCYLNTGQIRDEILNCVTNISSICGEFLTLLSSLLISSSDASGDKRQ